MKKTYIIGILMIAASLVTIFLAIGNTSSYVSFKEAGENPSRSYHVIGLWDKSKGVIYEPSKDPNYFAFYMRDSTNDLRKVEYRNNKPQDFEHSEKLVIVGKMGANAFQ